MTDWPRHAGSAIFSLFYAHVLSEMNKYETNHLSAPTVKTTLVWMSFHFLTVGGLVHVKIFVSDGWLWGWIMSHKSEGRKIFEDKEAIISPPPNRHVLPIFNFQKQYSFTSTAIKELINLLLSDSQYVGCVLEPSCCINDLKENLQRDSVSTI